MVRRVRRGSISSELLMCGGGGVGGNVCCVAGVVKGIVF